MLPFLLSVYGGTILKIAIAGAIVGMALAGLAYLAVKATVKFLKNYRKNKNSKVVAANMGSLIKNIPDKEKRTFSFDDLEKISNETVIAEYDENSDDIIHANFVGEEGMDDVIVEKMNENDGIILLKD